MVVSTLALCVLLNIRRLLIGVVLLFWGGARVCREMQLWTAPLHELVHEPCTDSCTAVYFLPATIQGQCSSVMVVARQPGLGCVRIDLVVVSMGHTKRDAIVFLCGVFQFSVVGLSDAVPLRRWFDR